jgi:sugar phosphate isomerase/epimerase
MITRRAFLRSSSAAAAAWAAAPLRAHAQGAPRIGIQLYTVRERAEADLPGTLKLLKDVGYEEVEVYGGVYPRPAAELRRAIADHGLGVPSGHFGYENLGEMLDYAGALGLRWMVCPMLPRAMWDTADAFKRAADQFNTWGGQVRARGMRFAYHNHNFEFARIGDTTGFEILVANTDPSAVFFELDLYWAAQAGRDPARTIRDLGSRVRLLHVKDRRPGAPTSQTLDAASAHFTEVGTGSLDFKAIASAARGAGVEHLFVEQDRIDGSVPESLRTSHDNARRLFAP